MYPGEAGGLRAEHSELKCGRSQAEELRMPCIEAAYGSNLASWPVLLITSAMATSRSAQMEDRRLRDIAADLSGLRLGDHDLRQSSDGGFPISELMRWGNYSFKDIMDAVVVQIAAFSKHGPAFAIRQNKRGETCLHLLKGQRVRPFPKDRKKARARQVRQEAAKKAARESDTRGGRLASSQMSIPGST